MIVSSDGEWYHDTWLLIIDEVSQVQVIPY